MAWNEPGGNDDKKNDDKNRGSKNNDPWKTNRGNRGNQGPPDLDEVFKKRTEKNSVACLVEKAAALKEVVSVLLVVMLARVSV